MHGKTIRLGALALATGILSLTGCVTDEGSATPSTTTINALNGPDCNPLVIKQGANLGIQCDLRGLTLTSGDFSSDNGMTTYGPEVDLTGAVISDVDFTRANLKYSTFKNIKLTRVKLNGANLPQGDFTGATLVDVDLRGAQLNDSTWVGASFTDVTLDADTICPDGGNWDGSCRGALPGNA